MRFYTVFEYSCFVSYRNSNYGLGSTFISELCDALNGELEQQSVPGIYLDRINGQPGDFLTPALSSALCRSACMIAIANPGYFDSSRNYCAKEYRAMEILERQRRHGLQQRGIIHDHGLIIPIIYRGFDRAPAMIKDTRIARDFSGYQLGGTQMSHNPLFNQEIRDIASYIARRYDELITLTDVCAECDSFELPTDEEIRQWLPGMNHSPSEYPRGGVS